jgi:hypothetical protein
MPKVKKREGEINTLVYDHLVVIFTYRTKQTGATTEINDGKTPAERYNSA